jgi:POT family proton-dependent oligopeptide transporter
VDPTELQACVGERVKTLLAENATMAADVAQNVATQTCSVSPNASVLYGWYTGLVYLTPVLGGLLADRFLGQKRAVYVGAIIMALGQFVLFGSENLFFIGLLLLIIGNGFFKPNISTQVGNLYPPGDRRRDGAFTIFYMGINIGAFLAPVVCGWLRQNMGPNPGMCFHYGFAAAGVGMVFGLVIFLWGQKHVLHAVEHRQRGVPPEELLRTRGRDCRMSEADGG